MKKIISLSTLFFLFPILAMESKEIVYSSQNLLQAIKEGDVDLIKQALENKIDPNEVHDNKYTSYKPITLLHHAAIYNNCPIIKLLVNNKADINKSIPVNYRFYSRSTPLNEAILGRELNYTSRVSKLVLREQGRNKYYPSYEAIKLLLKLSANLNPEGEEIDTYLGGIVSWQRDLTKLILAAGANPNAECFRKPLLFRSTWPMYTTKKNFELLLSYNADLGLVNRDGKTVFSKIFQNRKEEKRHYSISLKYIAFVNKILQNFIRSKCSKIILDYLFCDNKCSFLTNDINLELAEPIKVIDPLTFELTRQIIRDNFENITEMLLTFPHLKTIADVTGRTPLHWAAIMGNPEIVKLFLVKDIIDLQDDEGDTALHLAQEYPVIELLLKSGADKRILNLDGRHAQYNLSEANAARSLFNIRTDKVQTLQQLAIEELLNVVLADIKIFESINWNQFDQQIIAECRIQILNRFLRFRKVFKRVDVSKFSILDLIALLIFYQNENSDIKAKAAEILKRNCNDSEAANFALR